MRAHFTGVLFLLPLQIGRGMSAFESGLASFPQAIGVFLTAPLAGKNYGRVGPRRMMVAGLAGAALTTVSCLRVDLDTSACTIRRILLVRGITFALILILVQAATFAAIRPRDTGRASAAFNSIRQVAAGFGVALPATVLTNRLAHYDA